MKLQRLTSTLARMWFENVEGHEVDIPEEVVLRVERCRETKPAQAGVASALSCMGLDLSVWHSIMQVADAAIKEVHQGKDMHPKLFRSMVSKGALPFLEPQCYNDMYVRLARQ